MREKQHKESIPLMHLETFINGGSNLLASFAVIKLYWLPLSSRVRAFGSSFVLKTCTIAVARSSAYASSVIKLPTQPQLKVSLSVNVSPINLPELPLVLFELDSLLRALFKFVR